MKNTININVGKRVAELRRAAGITSSEFAGRIGITSHLLSVYEEGAQVIPASVLWDISIAQGVQIKSYFDEDTMNDDR